MSKTVDISAELAQAQRTGNVDALAKTLKGRPMSPSGFIRTEHGSFGDGEMEDRTWLQVESAVMDGELSEQLYNKLCDRLGC
jgi:hypothetical protein